MNSFESNFFIKYLPEDTEICEIIHRHGIVILKKIFIWLFIVSISSMFYYISYRVKEIIPFYIFEIFLFALFFKIVYDIFDWYNDVWIITHDGIFDIKWKLFKSETNSIKYENIEGVEVIENGFIDIILKKGSIIIHKIGDEEFSIDEVYLPYNALNEIENFTKEEEKEEPQKDKFELMMEALSGVVVDYMDRKGGKKEEKIEEYLEEMKKKGETIDLR
ncbi:hypothetical protein HGA92_03450 [Candidatus Gracilibacteria bacterium]|nr:hypothetical protein [Candidatus Gracilibacteria bacterium]NUJ99153.1 hypothetical protein [Candidatus Gracilibacteria bacterium]